MSDLSISELTKRLQRVDETLSLLIDVANETTPAIQAQAEKLKREVEAIASTVNAGFNIDKLRSQAKLAINAGVSDSNIERIQSSAEEAAKTLANAVQAAEQSATAYKNNADTYSKWIISLITATVFFIIGTTLMWTVQYNRIDNYQNTISWLSQPDNKKFFCKDKMLGYDMYNYFKNKNK